MGPESRVNLRMLIQTYEQIERTMAEIYDALALAHAHEPSVAALWSKTADEERNHERQLEILKKYEPKLSARDGAAQQKAEAALGEARKVLEQIRATKPPVNEALELCVAMEARFADFHAEAAFLFKDESHRKLFHALMAADRGHVEALQLELARRQPSRA